MLALPTFAVAKAFLTSKKFLIPAAIVALLLAIGGGTYLYLKHQTSEAVTSAVEKAGASATIQTYQTNDQVSGAYDIIDQKADATERQTIKDYQYVTYRIDAAPAEQKDAAVPPIIIDTLNELDRLRALRDAGPAGGVSDAEVPSG